MKRTHNLKIETQHFLLIKQGLKPVEFRLNDRNYQEGDILHLQEYSAQMNEFTGDYIDAIVLYIFDDVTYLQPNYVALMIDVIRIGDK